MGLSLILLFLSHPMSKPNSKFCLFNHQYTQSNIFFIALVVTILVQTIFIFHLDYLTCFLPDFLASFLALYFQPTYKSHSLKYKLDHMAFFQNPSDVPHLTQKSLSSGTKSSGYPCSLHFVLLVSCLPNLLPTIVWPCWFSNMFSKLPLLCFFAWCSFCLGCFLHVLCSNIFFLLRQYSIISCKIWQNRLPDRHFFFLWLILCFISTRMYVPKAESLLFVFTVLSLGTGYIV